MRGHGTCQLCAEKVSLTELMEHLRLFHPDEYGDGPEVWPDGEVVIYDETLNPIDFDE